MPTSSKGFVLPSMGCLETGKSFQRCSYSLIANFVGAHLGSTRSKMAESVVWSHNLKADVCLKDRTNPSLKEDILYDANST